MPSSKTKKKSSSPKILEVLKESDNIYRVRIEIERREYNDRFNIIGMEKTLEGKDLKNKKYFVMNEILKAAKSYKSKEAQDANQSD